MFTSAVVDDDYSSLELISEYIQLHPNVKLVKMFSDPLLCLKGINESLRPIDILFVDIEMPNINGIELARLVRHKVKTLIFTSAHTKYAFDSYEVKADAYLLKPFSYLKFSQTVDEVLQEEKINFKQYITHDFILINSKRYNAKYTKVYLSSIIAIESQNQEVKICTSDDVIFANHSLSGILKLLEQTDNFVQVHKSFVISQNHIKGIERKYVLLTNNLKIPIGRKYKEFYDKIFK
ncbi:LytR/AlgR family response regulator transcription factor [Pedobacter mendelii]|uniref:LytR/AlgR family response regulator transcription factor n=1 Tax=Pedobacter mendelii TaxID=1908240 RepID=UPI003611A331